MTFTSWRAWEETIGSLPPGWNKFPTPIEYNAAGGEQAIPATPKTGGGEVAIDLGANIFEIGGALLGQYLSSRSSPPPMSLVDTSRPRPGVVGVDTSALYNLDGTIKAKCKRRRRRKRLATASDIRDLASLEGVLGKGTLMKTWIATHPS